MRSHPVKDGSTLGDVTMASDYLDRSRSANKSMGKKAKAVRRRQSRAANEAVAYVVAGPKEMRGKYLEGGVGYDKLFKVAQGLAAAGKKAQAAAVRSRADAKFSGGLPPTTSSGMYSSYGQEAREALRNQSSSVFPRLNPFSGNTKTALINEIKQSVRSIQKKDMTRGTRFINKPR